MLIWNAGHIGLFVSEVTASDIRQAGNIAVGGVVCKQSKDMIAAGACRLSKVVCR